MGIKRPFSEVESSNGHPREYHGAREQRKKQKTKPLKRKEENISWVKKRARTIERMFQRDSSKLPANVQKDLERELAAHKQRIQDAEFKKRRSKMIGKYHMVRFFERQKADRMAKQLRRQIAQTTDEEEIAALKADLHVAEVDSHYARYFPFLEPYVSLYQVAKQAKQSKAADEDADKKSLAKLALHAPRPPLWSTIEEAMREGKDALEKLRDRDTAAKPFKTSKQSRKPKGRSEKTDMEGNRAVSGANSEKLGEKGRGAVAAAKRQAAEESDADDGGFFEEG